MAKTTTRPRVYQDWRNRHLRCCLACGAVWRRRRRKWCPRGCPVDLQVCLTCDRAWPEDELAEALDKERCPEPSEQIRRFVKAVGGDWDQARRRLTAAQGDIIRATIALQRPTRNARRGTDEERHPTQEAARVEGLIEAIAARSRQIGQFWSASTARASLAAGAITAEDLENLLEHFGPITRNSRNAAPAGLTREP